MCFVYDWSVEVEIINTPTEDDVNKSLKLMFERLKVDVRLYKIVISQRWSEKDAAYLNIKC
jgi:hypothetical protein